MFKVEGPELAPGELRAVEVADRRLVLCNADGRVYALEDRCPHADVALSGGRLTGTVLECPLHGGRLDVRDGSAQRPPIRRAAATFPVRAIEGGFEIEIATALEGERSA